MATGIREVEPVLLVVRKDKGLNLNLSKALKLQEQRLVQPWSGVQASLFAYTPNGVNIHERG